MEGINQATYSSLLIETEPGEIRAMVFDKPADQNPAILEISGELNVQLLSAHKIFRQNYIEVKLSVQTDRFSVIPDAFFDASRLEPVAQVSFGFDEKKDEILFSPIRELGVTTVFAIDKPVFSKIKEVFPQAIFFHSSKPFLLSVFNPQAPLTLYVQLGGKFVELTIMSGEKLIFYNLFFILEIEDAVYHVLNVCKTLKIQNDTIQVELLYEDNNKLFSDWLSKFYPNFQSVKSASRLKCPTVSLLNLNKCE
ncbi:MAG: DUF3822 family protein [Flavobacteriales bacterium]